MSSSQYPFLTQGDIQSLTLFFNFIDQDHDGLITINEIKEACAVDINGDGVISEEEKLQCARVWLESYFALQDVTGPQASPDQKLSLHEVLMFNNTYQGRSLPSAVL